MNDGVKGFSGPNVSGPVGYYPGDFRETGASTVYSTTFDEGWLECDGSAVSRTVFARLFEAIGTSFGSGDGATTFNVPDRRGRGSIGAGAGSVTVTFTVTIASPGVVTPALGLNGMWETGTAMVLSTTGALPTGLTPGTFYWIKTSSTQGQLATTLANAIAGTGINTSGAQSGVHSLTVSLTTRVIGQKLGEETHATVTAEIPAHTHTVQIGNDTATDTQQTLAVQGDNSTFTTKTSAATGGSTAHNVVDPVLVVRVLIKT